MKLTTEIGQAMMTLLSTLPVGTEVRFFWRDGYQHMSVKYSDGSEEIARLNSLPGGMAALIPASSIH